MILSYCEGWVEFQCPVCGGRRMVMLNESTHAIFCFHGQSLYQWKVGPARMDSPSFTLHTAEEAREYAGLKPQDFVGP